MAETACRSYSIYPEITSVLVTLNQSRELWTCFVVMSGIFLYFVFTSLSRPKDIPPGPLGLPVVGYAPFLGQRPHEDFVQLSKKYGNIFSIYLGPRLTIVLNDFQAVKAAYVDNAEMFADRRPGFAHRALNSSAKDRRLRGITMTNGHQWQKMRRFALTTLRNLGMGKSLLQEPILEEIEHLVETLKNQQQQLCEPEKLLIASIANIMFGVTFGKRFEQGHPQFKIIMDYLTIALPTLSNIGPNQLFRWIRVFPGKYRKWWQLFCKHTEGLKVTFRQELKRHRQIVPADDEIRDYVDAFLDQKRNEKEERYKFYYDEDELVVTLSNLFGAGAETTSSTIAWAYYFMVRNPVIQEKVQKEIDANVPAGHFVTMVDKTNLTYVEAVCQEVQRLGNLLPLAIARTTPADVFVLGYRIPKNSYVIPNLWNIHRDPLYWKNPDVFDPERFLDSEGRLLSPAYFLPFCTGKRQCPGESLAKMELFLFVANILQRFNIELPPNFRLPPPEESVNGLTARPPTYKVIFVPRPLFRDG